MATYNPFVPEFQSDPYEAYDALREEDPVHFSEQFGMWVLTRFDDCFQVLHDHKNFSSDSAKASGSSGVAALFARIEADEKEGGASPRLLLGSDPPEHTRLRSLVNHAFTTQRVRDLRPHLEELTESLLDQIPSGEPVEFMQALARPLPITVLAETLGVPPEHQEQFKKWSDGMLRATTLQRTPEDQAELLQTRRELRAYFSEVLEQRREKPGDDLISSFVKAQVEEDRLTPEEMLAFCLLLLTAGHETTTGLIGNATLALARHPNQADELREDPDLLPGAVEEFMRYDGPVQGVIRHSVADTEVGGVTIPKGYTILVMVAAANRDPSRFESPEVLDVHRKIDHQIGFGFGIHHCVGAALARQQAVVALGKVLSRFREIRLHERNVKYSGTFVLRGLKELHIVPEA